jgi:hypothetical protein
MGSQTFEENINPLIREFISKVSTTALNDENCRLHLSQIDHICDSLRTELYNLQYDSSNDLGEAINMLWVKGKRPKTTPNNKGSDTILS